MRLVMTILVKNEVDIIEDNIRFHHTQGIDAFLIMDNGSCDGTVECLQSLSNEFDITIIVNLGIYDQGPWMTELAKQARQQLGADFVISNDADEFWSVKGRSLKEALNKGDVLVTAKRYNFIQSLEAMNTKIQYSTTPYKVICPVLYSKEDQLKRAGLALPLVKISPKIIVKPQGLLKIKGGNHRAKHLKFWKHRETSDIEVHHYPIRNYAQFEANIENRRLLLDQAPNTRMGVHYKRWAELLRQGKLKQEFDNMSLSIDEIATLEKVGVIETQSSTPLGLWAKEHRNS